MITGSHKNKIFFSFLLIIASVTFYSCEESRVFDKNISTSDDGWSYDDAKTFDVFISDTVSTYNLFINVRHTDAYPYNNIWMKIITTFPDSTSEQGRINLQISEPDGIWTGNCADGICYNSVPVQQNFKFDETGKYTFTLQQDMRINPLPAIMNIGLKVEKFISHD